MSLIALTNVAEIAEQYARFSNHFADGCEVFERMVGFPGGSNRADVRWFQDLSFWAKLSPDTLVNNYWCACGLVNPASSKELSIRCEINIHGGGKLNTAGLFVRTDTGLVYLARTGQLRGSTSL